MNEDVRALEPNSLWNHFADLNAVPRPSKKEERVIKFITDFGAKLGLNTFEDEVGNVIIRKTASPGMENRETVMIQSHLDMVHQKNNDTNFDFDVQGIQMLVEGDWVKAKGTTLGADNGIGVASIMALLSSTDIEHPAIEALFTIDEETGMTGAINLKSGLLSAKIMLNLDTEDDRELTIGCAGGIDVTATGNYKIENTPLGMKAYKISVKGLSGGHSGMDIFKNRGNSNKLMNSMLSGASAAIGLRVSSIDGGSLRNAIPRESTAVIAIEEGQDLAFKDYISTETKKLQQDFVFTDPNLTVAIEEVALPATLIEHEFQPKFFTAIENSHNGVYRMSPDIKGLVQTSNNLARILLKDGAYSILCLTRSSADPEKMELANALKHVFEQVGANVTLDGEYPGWTPKPGSAIVNIMEGLYKEMFNEDPHVNACHAGLECGIIGAHYPEMEMISFGPNITGAHSPDEMVQISSVQKYWMFLLEALKRIRK
ncbi:MAG: aminoacyl-histidine dipeptidase [Bacteroidetes bacterium]|nr:aminoacyl-histidine dipeptidase [Bacteroidota bacterium]